MATQNFASHPISVISSFNSFRPTQKIKINHNREQFSQVFEEIENQLDQFDTLTNFAIKAYNASEDVKILKTIIDSQMI